MLREEIRSRMLQALRAGDDVRKGILKVALGEIQAAEVRSGTPLDDEGAAALVRKLVKANEESIALATNADQRARLAQENEILRELLPRTLDVEEIVRALEPVAAGIRQATGPGPAMGIAMKHLKSASAPVAAQDVSEAIRRIRS